MSSGIFLMFGISSMHTQNMVKSITNAFHMPYVTPSMAVNMTDQNLAYMLFMRPMYTKAIIDTIKYYGWTEIYYLYDTDEGQ